MDLKPAGVRGGYNIIRTFSRNISYHNIPIVYFLDATKSMEIGDISRRQYKSSREEVLSRHNVFRRGEKTLLRYNWVLGI